MTFYCVKTLDLSAFFTFVILSFCCFEQNDKTVPALFTCKQCSRNSFTRKTPAGSLLYKIKLILYMQNLVRRH